MSAMSWVKSFPQANPSTTAEHERVVTQWEEAERLEREAAELKLRAQSLRATAYFGALNVESRMRQQFGDHAVDKARAVN